MQVEPKDLAAWGNRVAVRLEFTSTYNSEFMGMPATDKIFRIQGMNFIHLNQADQPTDRWGNADWMGLIQQLGLMG
ncbi:ester cyclase [Meiothermus granaticius]|uniref:ester cyclase n=1 Tax=Meiothermus granaticius TaxID=863370 RepID=UPI0023E8CA7C|nr:ester cyclase [Meiothermus granaticius]